MLPRVPNSPPPRSSVGNGNSLSSRESSRIYRRGKSQKDERTLSQRFIRAPLFDISQFVWIEEDEKMWALCTILKQDNTILRVQDVDSGNVYQIDIGFDELKLCNKGILTDMSKLQHIHEPAILYNLSRRFLQRHQFYTYIGRNVLVSVNPLSWKYPAASMEEYFVRENDSISPHPFVLAEQAFQGICTSTRETPKHQSLVISGESGSGKTEASKLVLEYLAKRVETQTESTRASNYSSSHVSVSNAIPQSSPVLEAFGNAKTSHNPNSSRFGRYVKVFFDSSDSSDSSTSTDRAMSSGDVHISGAKHEIYLLEKSRVLGQAQGEQNFHIFYQYLSGIVNGALDGGHITGLQDMSDPDRFRLLNPCDSLDVMFDKFKETQQALSDVLTPDSTTEMWNVIGGILQLGNVEFVDNETAEGNTSYISGLSALQSACTLLDVDWKDMRHLMTQKVIETRDERFVVPLTLEGAVSTRGAMCKAIYETLFNSIVSIVNGSLSNSKEVGGGLFIGVLDLFGFESMAINGFNQFMINFANEAMHNCFNDRMLQAEVNLYEEENIQCSLSLDDCPNNTGCLALISSGVAQSKTPSSILLILDSISQQAKGGDEKFCESLHKVFGSNSDFAAQNENISQHFLYTHPKDQRHLFKVKHYAGVVTYSVQDLRLNHEDCDDLSTSWVESNKDAIPCALENILKSSGNSLLQNFANAVGIKSTAVAPNSNNLSRPKLRMKSVATMFSRSIHDLCSLVQSTDCYFIRCIKPNKDMTPEVVDNAYMIKQIRSLALVQTSQVKQVGLKMTLSFPTALSFLSTTLFTKDEYQPLLGHPPSVLVASWLAACGVPEDCYSIGKSKAFFRDEFRTQMFKDGTTADKRGASVALAWGNEEEIISVLSSKRPRHEVVSKVQGILLARKRREISCVQFQTHLEKHQQQLTHVKCHLQSSHSQEANVPSLVPFSGFFKLAYEANCSLEAAHFQADVVTNCVNAVEVAISSSTAPVSEALIIQKDILQRVSANRSQLSVLPSHVTRINTYEQETRAVVMKAQELFNDIAMGHWDSIALVEKSLEAMSTLVMKLDEGCGEGYGGLDALTQRIEADLLDIATVFAEKLPDPHVVQEDGGGGVVCDEALLLLCDEVISKGREVVSECDTIKQLCMEAEAELAESKKTLSFFEKATRTILRRIVVYEETSGDDHGMLWSQSEVEEKEIAAEKKKSLTSEHSVSFSDEVGGELDDEQSTTSPVDSERVSTDRMGSLEEGRRLTLKTLRIMQRGLSGMVPGAEGGGSGGAGAGGDTSFGGSFSRDSCDFNDDDDDDDISVIDMDFWIIPNGWEEYFDTDSQCSYYLNTITQTTQWERPEAPAEGTAGSVTWADDILVDTSAFEDKNTEGEQLHKDGKVEDEKAEEVPTTVDACLNEDISRSKYDTHVNTEGVKKKPSSHMPAQLSSLPESALPSTGTAALTLSADRGRGSDVPGSDSTDTNNVHTPSPSKCNLNYGRVTTTQLRKLSTLPKEGHLLIHTSSFFSSRWNRKYFVLDGLRLECYDKSEQYFYGLRKPKVLVLSLSTCTSFTDDANTFVVKTTDDKGHTVTWTLAAPNHTEKNEWVTYINAHVYTHHCNTVAHMEAETALDRRLMGASASKKTRRGSFSPDTEDKGVTFWQLTLFEDEEGDEGGEGKKGAAARVLPVGIRTLPDVHSSRTGEGIFPGEHVEVVATQEEAVEEESKVKRRQAVTYLQLADRRGWVFSLSPLTRALLFVPAVGYTYRPQQGLQFQVANTETNGVPIQYNPGDCSPFTGAVLHPGDIVETTASFQLDMDLRQSLFVKLADGRGWVNTRGQEGAIGLRLLN